MSQYIFLIYNDEQEWLSRPEDDRAAVRQQYFALADELRERGAYVDGAPLHPTTTARTVTRENGKPLVSDGPFAETKEQLGGYLIVDLPSAEEAVEWAAKIPATAFGRVEVREVLDVGAPAR